MVDIHSGNSLNPAGILEVSLFTFYHTELLLAIVFDDISPIYGLRYVEFSVPVSSEFRHNVKQQTRKMSAASSK